MAAMKPMAFATVLALTSLFGVSRASRFQASPVTQIVTLLTEMKGKLEADSQAEQRSYDKYACWCEDTLASKATEITSAKDQIEALQTQIVQLKGGIAAHGAEIKQLKKDILANEESQREATEMRNKESLAYQEDKAEFEQCIGALEAAIKVLTGAGSKGKFLETLQEAQLLSAVAGVRSMLHRPSVARAVGEKDLEVVQHFVERPEDFVGGRAGVLSAAQIAQNPFGDYAPQSTQIQGILKGMYSTFASDLEKSNAEEAQKQKGFEELMATKRAELGTLQTTLQKQTTDEADKSKQLADSKTSLDDTQAQLEADQAFFAETKGSCEEKAQELAQRVRLRTEELQGFNQAIAILSSPEAAATFANASSTFFLQLSAASRAENSDSEEAYHRLQTLAARYGSVQLARLAARVRAGSDGHFDQVIASIDQMVELLRREEQRDIKERDWCEGKQGKNKNSMEDLSYDITKATQTVTRLQTEATDLQTKVDALEADINKTNSDMTQLIQMRSQESADFLQASKDDTEAVALLGQAIAALMKFYKSNGLSLSLSQEGGALGLAASNASAAPPPTWESGAYGGRQGESGGIIAILKLVKEDYEKEILTSRQNDAASQVNFEKDKQALQNSLDAYETSKAATEKELADVNAKIVDLEKTTVERGQDLTDEQKVEADLNTNCAWVKTHFQSRRDKRKAEVQGLIDAKNFLAGSDDGI